MIPVSTDPFVFNAVIETLQAYSLLVRDPHTHSVSVHRLVQAVMREGITTETKKRWKLQAVLAVNAARPALQDVDQWDACEQWLPHALVCAIWIEQEHLQNNESASLLNTAGSYNSSQHGEQPQQLGSTLLSPG